jgi:hypothetical protein
LESDGSPCADMGRRSLASPNEGDALARIVAYPLAERE